MNEERFDSPTLAEKRHLAPMLVMIHGYVSCNSYSWKSLVVEVVVFQMFVHASLLSRKKGKESCSFILFGDPSHMAQKRQI